MITGQQAMDLVYLVGVPLEIAKQHALWGTVGKNGDEPLRVIRLIEASTEHLQAILRTQPQIYHTGIPRVIREILKDRGQIKWLNHTAKL